MKRTFVCPSDLVHITCGLVVLKDSFVIRSEKVQPDWEEQVFRDFLRQLPSKKIIYVNFRFHLYGYACSC